MLPGCSSVTLKISWHFWVIYWSRRNYAFLDSLQSNLLLIGLATWKKPHNMLSLGTSYRINTCVVNKSVKKNQILVQQDHLLTALYYINVSREWQGNCMCLCYPTMHLSCLDSCLSYSLDYVYCAGNIRKFQCKCRVQPSIGKSLL